MVSEFKIGDLAVYPAQGVAEIIGIESRSLGALSEVFYTLRILDSEKRIMIPVGKVNSVGLRPLVGKEEVENLLCLIQSSEERLDNHETWNRRYRRYLDKIKSGEARDVSEVFRDLSQIKKKKDLSFGERKMLEMARLLLVKEFSIAMDIPEANMDATLSDLVS